MPEFKVADLFAKLGLRPDTKQWAAGDRLISGIKKGLAALAGFAAVKWSVGVIQQVANTADALDEMSQKLGVPVETLQELGYAAGFSGVNLEALGSSVAKLSKAMDAAAHGSKAQARVFREMGVAVKDARGELRPVEDVFGDVADHFASMPDGAAKTALAMKVFGKTGAELIPVLNEGREGLEKLKEEFRASGAEISGDAAQAFAKFNDDQDRLKNTIQGLKVQLVTALLPTLQKVLTRVLEWVKANRALIIERLTSALRTLGGVLQTLYAYLAPVVRTAYEFVEAVIKAADRIGILKHILVAAAVAVGLSWAAALLPFVLLAAAIGGIILIIEDLWAWKNGEKSAFQRIYESAKEWIADKLGGVLDEYEKRMVALGLLDGNDIVSRKMALEFEDRNGRGLAQINDTSDAVDAIMSSRAPQSWDEVLDPSRIPSVLQDRADVRAQQRRQRAAREFLADSELGARLGFTPAGLQPSTQVGPQFVPSSRTTSVSIGDIHIDAKNADAAEVGKHVRAELEALTRSVLDASGGRAAP